MVGDMFDTMEFVEVLESPQIVIYPLGSHHMLEDIRPDYVVVYDPDVKFIRELEVSNTNT